MIASPYHPDESAGHKQAEGNASDTSFNFVLHDETDDAYKCDQQAEECTYGK
ncbi:MAG: hypothetical protein ACSHX9_17090 [Luteolibacter sp.]